MPYSYRKEDEEALGEMERSPSARIGGTEKKEELRGLVAIDSAGAAVDEGAGGTTELLGSGTDVVGGESPSRSKMPAMEELRRVRPSSATPYLACQPFFPN